VSIPDADGAPLLRLRGIRKAYPGVVALDGVDFDLRAGEVHVLLGENGAGKSTFVRILSGATMRDAGDIEIDGRPAEIDGPRHAQDLGISAIYQEFNLVPQLSAAENIFLGREPSRGGVLDRPRLVAEAAALLEGLGVRLDPRTPVALLGVAQQQMVEVAKALSTRARVLIMDEPTSALTESEIRELFAAMRGLTARGVGIIYISHRMEEIAQVAHRITVFRDGRRVGTVGVGDATVPGLIRMMAGRELTEHFPRRRGAPGAELLRVENLRRGRRLRDVSLTLRAGEVVGIAGLLGAGRTELARAVVGADRPESGRVFIQGREVHARGPADTVDRGVGFLPEDRKTQGLVLGLAVQSNLALPSARRLSRHGVLDARALAALARKWVDDLRIKTPTLAQPVGLLSGGNQQKAVLGKWLATGAQILILDEPTRGIDVGARMEIYELMNRLTDAGAGILMISSDLPEVLGMSDRVLVMREGTVHAEFAAADATQERVLGAALGQAS
jgi:ribose transport system ATP-binding protein